MKSWAGESQTGIKNPGRNINNLRYADDTILMAENEDELKSLMKEREKSEKDGLKLNIQKWEGGSCLGMHVRIKDFKI